MVYGSGLENQRVFTGTVGSNPTLSALHHLNPQSLTGFFNAWNSAVLADSLRILQALG